MKYKKGLIFLCLIICLFCIGSVVAANSNATDIHTADSEDTELEQSNSDMQIDIGKEVELNQSDSKDTLSEVDILNNPIQNDDGKINTKIIADNITTFPREGRITFKLTDLEGNPLEGCNVTLDVKFIHRNFVTNATGEGYFNINGTGANLDVGNYTGVIKFLGNENYNPSSLSINIKICKWDTTIICDNLTFIYNESGILIACLKDSDGTPIKNANLDLVLGKVYDSLKTNGSGEVGFNMTRLSVGTYTGNIYFDETNRYKGSTIPVKVIVMAIPTVLNLSDRNGTVGHELTLTANVNSSNNFKINGGVVVFFDNKNNIGQANVFEGIATLTYTPSTDGEHNITAVFNSNDYLSSNNSAKLLVDSATVEILVDGGTVGFNSTFFVNVKGLYSVIDEGSIGLYVDDEFIDKVNVIKGSATLYYVPLKAKNYMVKIIFSDSVNFLTDEKTTVFNVKKADSQVIINDIECKVNHNVTLTAYITSSNNLTINEGKISFFDGEVRIGEDNVNNGIASLIFTPDTVGNHTITAIFKSDNYLSSNDSANLLVGGTVKANDMIVAYGKGYDFIASFFKPDGTSLSDSYVIFSVNGKDYVVKTDSNGIAILAIGLSNGVYNITSTNILTGESVNNVLTIVGQPAAITNTVISAYDITTVYNGGKYLIATLKDINGKSLVDVQLSINLNSVKYLTTDNNGQVKLSTNGLAPKTYAATITFAGNTNYAKSTATVKVTVTKATPKLTAKAKTFKKSLKTKRYTITLKDNQNKAMKNTKVTIKINKKVYTAKTNSKGVATFKIKKLTKKGTFKSTVSYKGDKYYNMVTKTVKIKIK